MLLLLMLETSRPTTVMSLPQFFVAAGCCGIHSDKKPRAMYMLLRDTLLLVLLEFFRNLCLWRAQGWNETDVPNETWNVSEEVWEDVNESVGSESIDGNLSDWSLVFDRAAGASAEFCICIACSLGTAHARTLQGSK